LLTEKLLLATWRTPLEGREIKARKVVVDTGGEDGVTDNAYAWLRRVRLLKLSGRVMLYKGASTKAAPVIKETKVGKRNANSKPDVPLFVCNPNLLSDIVDAGLRRETPGPGYIHFPAAKHPTKNPSGWLPQAFFDELGAEVREKNGTWKQVRKRNESFDLCRMIAAGLLNLGLDKIRDWNVVPAWLAPLDQNEDVITVEDRRAMKENAPVDVISEAPKARVVRTGGVRPRRRASVGSPYLR
jgi:phage terminase large subunit GpA-like protein